MGVAVCPLVVPCEFRACLPPIAGLSRLEDLNLQGCRNLANPGGSSLSGLPALHGLTALCMRGCDRLTGAPAVWTSSLCMACKDCCVCGW